MKKKVLVSACLLGENCRHDGSTKEIPEVSDELRGCEIIPFCPEHPVCGTPREKISVVEIDGEMSLITDESNEDVTKLLTDEINSFIASNEDIHRIVLKSKSPSCGLGTTPILNKDKEVIKHGDGLAAKIFKKHYKDILIQDERTFF
jgi:uncharacterized protein YbbK (DUF523 family)